MTKRNQSNELEEFSWVSKDLDKSRGREYKLLLQEDLRELGDWLDVGDRKEAGQREF